jgi:hypothetical protein
MRSFATLRRVLRCDTRREHYRRKGKTETFLAFERNMLFGEPAAKVAEELGMSPASVHVAKMRVTRRLTALRSRA